MSARAQLPTEPYPWQALPKLTRTELELERNAHRTVERLLDFSRLPALFQELFAAELESFGLQQTGITERPRSLGADTQLQTEGCWIWISVQPALASLLLSRVLGRPTQLNRPEALEGPLLGAWHAIADELARRLARDKPLAPSQQPSSGPAFCVDFWLRLDGISYRGRAALRGEAQAAANADRNLQHCELPVRLQLVLGTSACDRAQLRDLQLGDAFIPAQWMVDNELRGQGVLCAPSLEQGLLVQLNTDEPRRASVVGSQRLPHELEKEMSDTEKDTSHDAVADAPVLVRVEVGSVTMSAREWVALSPGDVIGLGGPLEHPVTLRVTGQRVAEGELVNIDGELGVRVTKLS